MVCILMITNNMQAQITLPSILADHMVLQQNADVPVWGWGVASAKIRVVGSWAPQDTATTTAAPNGYWEIRLKTTSAGGPYTVHIFGSGSRTLTDVMLGEVWLCSGQSNMEWTPMNNIDNRNAEIAAASNPNIRFFHIPKRGADSPQNTCDASWNNCTPETMKRTSAVAYFFGRTLEKALNVPVGLIISAWGGTPAEVWTPKDRVLSDEKLRAAMPAKTTPWWPVEAGALYNQMIHPVMPYGLAGSIWYQGESNCDQPTTYGALLQTMIESWREGFKKDFPFYLVQIAPHTYKSANNGPALIREQQEWVSRTVPGTGLVVVSDLVNNVTNIHPTDKQHVGLRLANLALGKTYKKLTEGYETPVFNTMSVDKNKAIITFLQAEKGLACKDKTITGFQIADDDGIFTEAKAEIKGCTVVVSSPAVKHPAVVRYCFDDATIGNLSGKDGLPVAPFRSDRNWNKNQ